jgi:tetratricopeptide (TPR) repeat protein
LDVCSVPLASAFIFINVNPKTFKENKKLINKHIDFVITKLFKKQSINDIDVLTKAIKRLKSLSKYSIIGSIYNKVLELIKIDNLKSVDLLLESHIYNNRKILLSKIKLIEQLIDDCKNDKDKGVTYLSLAEYYAHNSNYKKSIKYFKKAQNLTSFNDLDHIFDGLSILSLNNDLLDDALSYATYSFSYRMNKYGLNSIKIADSYFLLGRIWDSYGYREESEIVKNDFFTKAIENYFKSIEIEKKHVGNYHQSVATLYQAIGNSYKCISLFSDAIDNLQISLQIVKEIDGEKAFKVADLKSDIADILISINRKEEAIILLQDSYDIFKKLGVKNIFAITVLEMINEIKNDR